MTIDECDETWINGNLSTVIGHVISRSTHAEVAYYAAAIACQLKEQGALDSDTFLHLIAARMIQATV